MSWIDYWNSDTPIYVNARHKRVHYDGVTRDILPYVPHPGSRVVDYGCGDTLSADRLAAACGELLLCDAAPRVREELRARYAGNTKIAVIAPEEFEILPGRTVDLIVANSVVQYLSMPQFTRLLAVSHEKLEAGGRLLLADIVPRTVGPLTDATALLKYAAANGFLVAAMGGLARSYFSSYRKVREDAGFLQFDEAEMLRLLREHGFEASRQPANLGHNAARMTFLATAS